MKGNKLVGDKVRGKSDENPDWGIDFEELSLTGMALRTGATVVSRSPGIYNSFKRTEIPANRLTQFVP